MRIVADWLQQPAVQAVFVTLASAGHQALAVGGCVRNALLQVTLICIPLSP